MLLSEAIRLGAMALPEVHGPVFRAGDDGHPCAACAIGAALYAIGKIDRATDFISFVYSEWPWTRNITEPTSTSIELKDFTGLEAIVHLFETRRWSREKIAAWVETIERRADAEAVAMEPAVATPVALCAPK